MSDEERAELIAALTNAVLVALSRNRARGAETRVFTFLLNWLTRSRPMAVSRRGSGRAQAASCE